LRDEGGDIAVSLGPLVDGAVVLDGSKLSIFLFDKKEVCGIGAPRFADCPPL